MRGLILTFVILLALLAVPLVTDDPYVLHIMILLFLNTSLGQSWNIIGGYTGQYSVGHSAYFGFGAYTAMILLTRYGIAPWWGCWLGVLMGVIVSLAVGSIVFRLRGPYFVLASIATAEIFRISAINLTDLTNGAQGILATDIPPFKIGSWVLTDFISKVPYYYMGLSLAVATLAMSYATKYSKLGYYFQAIREDQDAADSLGINLAIYKSIALGLSAAFTALAGGFAAFYVGYIDPSTVLSLDLSVSIVLICIIGGIGRIFGPMIGAIVIVSLSEILRSNLVPQLLFKSGLVNPESRVGAFLGEQVAHAHVLIYGILVVIVILFMPKGVLGFAKSLVAKWKKRKAVA